MANPKKIPKVVKAPKRRDLEQLGLILRKQKRGAFPDQRRKANRQKCRKDVNDETE